MSDTTTPAQTYGSNPRMMPYRITWNRFAGRPVVSGFLALQPFLTRLSEYNADPGIRVRSAYQAGRYSWPS